MKSNVTVDASSKFLFIADAHLGAFSATRTSRIQQELIDLVDFAETNGFELVFLGDLFDYWIEYPGFTPPLAQRLRQRLKSFNDSKGEALFVTGNHDNWTLGHFEALGFDVEPDYRILSLNGQQVLLLHGDATGPSPAALTRPLFHRIIRNEYFLSVYRALLPAKAGLAVMRTFSRLSRWAGDDADDPAHLNNWARAMLKQHKIDYIISGHDHHPRDISFAGGRYLNTGAFYRSRSLVCYNNNEFSLVSWNSDTAALQPFEI